MINRTILLSKNGFAFKLISILIQNIIILPLSFIISFILTATIMNYVNINDILLFKTMFVTISILLNSVWTVKNSLIVIFENTMVFRNVFGRKEIVDISNIDSICIIGTKELREFELYYNRTFPIISNCFTILIPIGKTVCFSNSQARKVIVGTYQYKKLVSILNSKTINMDSLSLNELPKSDLNISGGNEVKDIITNLKMPFTSHIILFFSHFWETIVLPIVVSALFSIGCNLSNIKVHKSIWITLCVLLSAFEYYKKTKVVISIKNKIIKLRMFKNKEKNYISIQNISNVTLTNDLTELEFKSNAYETIETPYYKNGTAPFIVFVTDNKKLVCLSIQKTKDVYQYLIKTENNK